MERGEYLTKIMEDKGFNAMSLSKSSGVPYTTIRSMIERNLTNASVDNVIKICKVLGVSVETLNKPPKNEKVSESRQVFEFIDKIINLPIVGTISCGNGVLAYEDIEGYENVPESWTRGGEHFFLRAKGDSMINARIDDGDLLLIRKQDTFENGEIMAVMVDDEAVLKRIYRTDGQILLQSENTKYPPRFITDPSKIRIIGKLKMNFIHY
ncbi:SOS response transcriptional repressor, RecA-mediated autopeptidase [Schinkia azotoformans MEV2011]|uniref:SOS response transcriptional repressor, RecA-mediated autopeptidase n=1 Tax=Schinkia azotoformans MEV2011 TaxID=1348973 RepID=A0A072NR78_SCHAZ|nr:XRE family transcriptional regulator [Schinkia azotoformans]KEF40164.1 SOS response transcriptional repressor, RecA-mediated autopeptidase [Schinkia azotoformans MEV2011]